MSLQKVLGKHRWYLRPTSVAHAAVQTGLLLPEIDQAIKRLLATSFAQSPLIPLNQ